jgi:hypothetical protein
VRNFFVFHLDKLRVWGLKYNSFKLRIIVDKKEKFVEKLLFYPQINPAYEIPAINHCMPIAQCIAHFRAIPGIGKHRP